MRRYYLMLSDEDISGSVYLMSAMSMLYSMLMDFDRSEFWYQKLKEYRDKVRGSEQREATCRLVYLDIPCQTAARTFANGASTTVKSRFLRVKSSARFSENTARGLSTRRSPRAFLKRAATLMR